ncbi:MAG: hypothetical protein JO211_13010 [Acidobacteriaceae bacterium]|nr:hypothetical protein [Acidobacteriaceae bacterium]
MPSNRRCTFCRQSETAVGKLISSPSDHPRAYICYECVAICNSIIAEDAKDRLNLNFIPHPLAVPFFTALQEWLYREDHGEDGSAALNEVRSFARSILRNASRQNSGGGESPCHTSR